MMQIGFYLDHYFIHHFLEIFVVITFHEWFSVFYFRDANYSSIAKINYTEFSKKWWNTVYIEIFIEVHDMKAHS